MTFKGLLKINSVFALVSGIGCVIAPSQLLTNYNVSLSPMGLVVYQFWGAALIGLGMITWLVSGTENIAQQRKLALALLITNSLSFILAIRGQYAGANSLGWSTVALFFILTVGYGFFTLMKQKN